MTATASNDSDHGGDLAGLTGRHVLQSPALKHPKMALAERGSRLARDAC